MSGGTRNNAAGAESALVIVTHRNRLTVRTANGETLDCPLPSLAEPPAVGDEVELLEGADKGTAVIDRIRERRSRLARSTPRGVAKVVAANIDRVVVVFATRPPYATALIDRHLIVAEHAGVRPLLALNKIELLTGEEREAAELTLAVYVHIGYELHEISVKRGTGMDRLAAALRQQRSILVGQSGVGKSSIIAALTGEERITVRATSRRGSAGRHTTSGSRLYPLPQGGDIIDTPGAHDFGLWHVPPQALDDCFVEFRPFLGECRFADCRHLEEPDCAVQTAVAAGAISAQRLASYRGLRTEFDDG